MKHPLSAREEEDPLNPGSGGQGEAEGQSLEVEIEPRTEAQLSSSLCSGVGPPTLTVGKPSKKSLCAEAALLPRGTLLEWFPSQLYQHLFKMQSIDDKDGGDALVACCRVCLEEDSVKALAQPCCCTGTMSHAHTECIQRWIMEKGDMLCEICKQPYKGDFQQPPVQPCPSAEPRLPLFRGFLIAADPETGAFPRRGFHEDHGELDQEQASATWCLAAVLIFMSLLLVRHIVELLSEPVSYAGKPDLATQPPDFTDGGVIFSWGSFNRSDGWDAAGAAATAPDAFVVMRQAEDEEVVSPWVLMTWLLIRFAIVLIPAVLAYRLMRSFRPAQQGDSDPDRSHANILMDMEAGVNATPADGPASAVSDPNGAVHHEPLAAVNGPLSADETGHRAGDPSDLPRSASAEQPLQIVQHSQSPRSASNSV